jgi:hypothetical protein
MNRLFRKRIAILMISSLFFSSIAFSQVESVDFLRSAPEDGVKILSAYIAPWINAFGAGLNGSWYNTAKPHKFGGFDITLGINVGMVPSSEKMFAPSQMPFQSLILIGSELAPTIAGPQVDGPKMNYVLGSDTLASFNTPPGTNWRFIPVPTIQIGIGLPKGTEIKGRIIPRIPFKNFDVFLWGAGLMHSISQYFPGDKLLPYDISVFGGYTRLVSNVPTTLKPYGNNYSNYSSYNADSFSDQKLSIIVEAWNVGALASVNLKVITFYGGLGYSKTNTSAKLEGNYPTPTWGGAAPVYSDAGVITGAEFGEIGIKNYSGLRANAGFRLKLSVVTFHIDYTWSHYSVFSTGLGISIR